MYKKIGKYFLFGILVIGALVAGARGFYEVYIYPGEVRKECDTIARKLSEDERSISGKEARYDFYYASCFRQRGLEPEK